MPPRNYDQFFGGQPGAADKALAAMRKTYGKRDGDVVFNATVAKRRRKQAKTRRQGWFR
jgi:hypothetical protein